jgi:integrase
VAVRATALSKAWFSTINSEISSSSFIFPFIPLILQELCNLPTDEEHYQFEQLKLEAMKTQANTFAKGTRKNLRSSLKTFIIFCVKFGRPICPTDRSTLMSFAQLMSMTVGYGHIKMMHKALDATFPEEDFQVDSTLKAIKRQLAGTPFQTLPITPEILGQLYLFVDIDDPEQLAFWCSILTGFRCLLRKSNLVPVSLDKFDPLTGLSRSKIMLPNDKDVALVYLNWSKTNQFGNREMVIPMVADSVSALDPVLHLKLLFSNNLPDHLPAFSFVKNGRIRTVTYDKFTKDLRNLLDRSGYRSKSYSGHSLRRGGASYLYRLGADPLLIKAMGDWQSDCYQLYIHLSLEQRLAAQTKMATATDF